MEAEQMEILEELKRERDARIVAHNRRQDRRELKLRNKAIRVRSKKALRQWIQRNKSAEHERLRAYRATLPGFLSGLLSNAKKRGKDCTIELPDLVRLWEAQGGKCALSGVPMNQSPGNPFKASLDRIDSDLGYHVSNIQFICAPLQFLKGRLTMEQLLTWCRLILRHTGK
ncbi:MAG: hypothetical protein NTW86_22635 [Candidatus Sumerlaeota bacterium]|nr:hypothetical protein [Candidatus Sumerlaeota bacterium]